METPSVALNVWILAAFDPFLIAISAYIGWRADQFVKIFLAALAAPLVAVLVGWAITSVGLPWLAPVGGENPLLLQVRVAAACIWASSAYFAKRLRP
ncbi:MAG: hypothetical protein MEP57_07015 [Microvirga sp.]|nr:hypothetical protein [Microvirga sp.]